MCVGAGHWDGLFIYVKMVVKESSCCHMDMEEGGKSKETLFPSVSLMRKGNKQHTERPKKSRGSGETKNEGRDAKKKTPFTSRIH